MALSVSHPVSTLDQYRVDTGCDTERAIQYSLLIEVNIRIYRSKIYEIYRGHHRSKIYDIYRGQSRGKYRISWNDRSLY